MDKKILFKIFSDELSGKDWIGILISILILFVAFFSIPTILNYENNLLTILLTIYSKYTLAYNLVFIILTLLLSYSIYFFVKLLYIYKYKHFLYQEEAFSTYLEFMKDAKELYIFSGDLSFFQQDNQQFQRVLELGRHCKILCEQLNNNPNKHELVKIYKHLTDAGVQIKCYADDTDINTSKFRGQIKLNNNVVYENLFMKKMGSHNRYISIDIQNQYVTKLLKDDFDKIFEKGVNPLISYIVFDLGGVYFKGDFHSDFLKVLKDEFNIEISTSRDQKLYLDRDLITGNQNIIVWVKKQTTRVLTEDECRRIKEIWENIWSPDDEIHKIAEKLSRNYNLAVMSNLDKENGEKYYQKGYLDIFGNNVFLSYELQISKPDDKFFKHIEMALKVMPYEILLIDDHESNIQKAEQLGWNAIKYDNTVLGNDELIKKLKKFNVHV